ncbi:MAG TPA: hypothetical protein VFB96_17285 [Pirellulaceae bacterium]|nr:hypothetical protein [Pirellulaceae bacterium]
MPPRFLVLSITVVLAAAISNGCKPGAKSSKNSGVSGGITIPAREPKPSGKSWVPSVALASADPATWKVTADEVKPAANLKSYVALELRIAGGAAFARPDAAQAAVIDRVVGPNSRNALDWVRCDLTQTKPVGRVHLWQTDTPDDEMLQPGNDGVAQLVALSPSGDRLAVAIGQRVWVWSKEGARVAYFKVPQTTKFIGWIAFAGEERMWIHVDGILRLHALPGGEVAATAPQQMWLPLMTPGGKWLAGVVGQELIFLAAADGSRAGSIPLPADWRAQTIAMEPGGTQVALALANNRADTLIGVWELATGKLSDSVEQTYARVQQRLAENRLHWCGKNLLLCSHTFFHLGVKEILAQEGRADSIPAGAAPDGRLWTVRVLADPAQVQQLQSAPAEELKTANTLLAAATLPPAAYDPIFRDPAAFAWHPGITVNVVLSGVPPKFQQAVAAGLADAMAQQGYRVDPEAKLKLEFNVKLGPDAETVGKDVPQDQLTPRMKEHLKKFPIDKWVELVTVKNIIIEGIGYDAAGKPAFGTKLPLFSRPVDEQGSDEPLWEALAKWESDLNLPRTFFRDPAGQRVVLPKMIVPGIDGLVDPVIEERQIDPLWEGYQVPGEKAGK